MDRYVFASPNEWQNEKNRKPLLVSGARQVGKTYIIESFGENCFTNMVINFELQPNYKKCFIDLDPYRVVDALSSLSRQVITPGKMLLFLDLGLVQQTSGLEAELLLQKDLMLVN